MPLLTFLHFGLQNLASNLGDKASTVLGVIHSKISPHSSFSFARTAQELKASVPYPHTTRKLSSSAVRRCARTT